MYFNSDQTEMNAAEKKKKKTDEGDLPSHIFNIANYLAFYRYTKKNWNDFSTNWNENQSVDFLDGTTGLV